MDPNAQNPQDPTQPQGADTGMGMPAGGATPTVQDPTQPSMPEPVQPGTPEPQAPVAPEPTMPEPTMPAGQPADVPPAETGGGEMPPTAPTV
jgi:hypothetical protein